MKINYFPLLTLCFALGIWLGQYSLLPFVATIGLLMITALVAYIVQQALIKEIAYLAVFFVLGVVWSNADVVLTNLPEQNLPRKTELVMMVNTVPDLKSYGVTFIGKAKARNVIVRIKAHENTDLNIRRGDILQAKGELSFIEGPRNPGEFDFKKYYHIRKVDYQMTVNNDKFEIVGYNEPNILVRLSDYLRNKAEQTVLSVDRGQAGAVFTAMISGDTKLIDGENLHRFKKLGLMHLFAISGLNVGIIVGVLLFITKYLKLNPYGELMVLALVLIIYAAVAEFSVSVLRAVVIALFYVTAKVISRETKPLIPVSLAAFLFLAYNPRLIGDLGFLLTFGTVLGLVFFTEIFSEAVEQKRWELLFGPIAAQLPILPLLLSYFHVLGFAQLIMAVPSTLLSFPMVFAAFLTLLFAPFFNIFAQASATVGIIATKILLLLSEIVARLPFGVKYFSTPHMWQVILFYSLLAVSYIFYSREQLSVRNTVFVMLLIPLVLLIPPQRDNVIVTFIDVGQGDAILLEMPEGKNILIDGGGFTPLPGTKRPTEYDVGSNIVLPVLYSKGIDQLDYVIATHPHADHIDGLASVLKDIKVKKLIHSPYENKEGNELKELAVSKGVENIILNAGDSIKLSDIKLELLGPLRTYNNTRSDANNYSLVVKLSYGKGAMLLTGDVENEAMHDIARRYDLSDIIFLKAPHHGSKYSLNSAFLEEASPSVIITSVGKNNMFGHPAKEILTYWQEKDIPLFRTDQDGAVEISMEQSKALVETYLSRKKLRVLYSVLK